MANRTPRNPAVVETPITSTDDPALFDVALGPAAPECVPLAELPPLPDGALVLLGRAVYSAAELYCTQLEDEGIAGVYGTVVIGPRDSGGWKYVWVTPPDTYTPGGVMLSPSHTSNVPFLALLGALYAQLRWL